MGKLLRPLGVAARPILPIESNTATTITVLGDFAFLGIPDLEYRLEDYRLSDGSPCIDAGSNGAIPTFVATDLDGAPRRVDVALLTAAALLVIGVYSCISIPMNQRQS